MGLFNFMSGQKKPKPGEVAKERLKVALVHDRFKVNPELLELLKTDLLAAISRRLEVDEQHLQLSVSREGRWDKLLADVPIKRQKVAFEWDPPARGSAMTGLRGPITIEVEHEGNEG